MAGVSPQLPPKAVLTESWRDTITLLHTAATKNLPRGVDTTADWQRTIDTFAKSGLLKRAGIPSDYWDVSFAPKA
jgi:NitT/TauT family transport system substrate-binding protein